MNAHNQRVVADHNRKVDAHNRKVVNDYNQRVRANNDRPRREIPRLNSTSRTRHVAYRTSVTTLRQSFSQLETAADSASWAGSDDLFELSESDAANSVAALNALLAEPATDPARNDEIAVLRLGLGYPVEYGGRDAPISHQIIFTHECALARVPYRVSIQGSEMLGHCIVASALKPRSTASCRPSCQVRHCGVRGSANPTPARTCPTSALAPNSTAMSG